MAKHSRSRRALALSLILALAMPPVSAASLEDIFNGVNSYGNTTSPSSIQGQTMNYYSGGSMFMRTPRKSYQLAAATAPDWKAGCGGIDLFAGAFSFINKDNFVAMLRNIGQSATGYAFKLAVQNLCPVCDNVIQALEATARAMNGMNINSCEMAEGVVNAAVPDQWKKSEVNLARTLGPTTNQFDDAFDAWRNVFSDRGTAQRTIDAGVSSQPEIKDKVPEGNVTWKALKKLPGLDDATRELYMSMIGTVIFDSNQGQPIFVPDADINIKMLIGVPGEINAKLPVYRCDNTAADGCKQLTVDETNQYKSLLTLVSDKFGLISKNIASRSPYGADLPEIIQFVNVTDIPVYKLIATATQINNTDMANAMLSNYKEWIAARYAQVFIESVGKDLRFALLKLQTSADATQGDAIKTMLDRLSKLESNARAEVNAARSQTISNYSIAQEIEHLERTLNNSLSSALQDSLAFQKTLGS